jgi:L-ascorbate metabolism protein UlaG (beta-lactamase superfamily)
VNCARDAGKTRARRTCGCFPARPGIRSWQLLRWVYACATPISKNPEEQEMNIAHAAAALAFLLAVLPAGAQNVKITPVGSHPGELCANDRAMIFEDPTGVRILYDAGYTVTGADDARLGTIHAVLLSHAHGDHVGDQKLKAVGAGECANPDKLPAPNSTTAEIAAAKNAAIVMTGDMGMFIGRKIQNIRGRPVAVCPQTAGVTTVPVAAACRSNTYLGGTFIAKTAEAAQGVEITIVFASHANNAPLSMLSAAQRASLEADDTGLGLGPPTGFVVKFSNGLVAYLSGDTGIHAEMKTVVHDFHKANLAVLNLGPSAGSVVASAYEMNELVRPASVILTHANEAVTEGGKLLATSRAAALVKQLRPTPYLGIGGRTMEFDGKGKCVAGC